MKIAYVTTVRMPTEKAHGLQIMQMCRAFAQNGHEVTLLVPKRRNPITQDAFSYYGIEPNFTIEYLPCIDALRYAETLGNPALWITSFTLGLAAERRLAELAPDITYTRDPFMAPRMQGYGSTIFEAHDFPKTNPGAYSWIWKKFDRIVTVTEGLKQRFVEAGVPETKLVVAHDAVDARTFEVQGSKREARKQLGLNADAFIAVYAGHMYPNKGVPDLLEAAKLAPDVQFVIVGGTGEGSANIRFVGRVPHQQVAQYLRTADVTVLPNRGGSAYDERYVSPMKLFEYLAAGRAIVTTDLPAIREVLRDSDAVFVPPQKPQMLADALNRLAQQPDEIARLEAASRALAARFTWRERANAVIGGLTKKLATSISFWRRYRLELALAGFAFFIRLIYVALFPQYTLEGGDGPFYLALADHLRGAKVDPSLPLYYQPLYPAMLAVVRTIFGEALIWGRIVQALLSASTVFVSMVIARRWATPYATWVVGLLGALYVPAILESGTYYTETTYSFLLTLSVLAVLIAMESKKTKDALLAGVALSVTLLTRDIALYLAPILAVVAGTLKKSWKLAVYIIIPVLMTVGATAIHNRAIAGSTPSNYVPLVGKRYNQALGESEFQKLAFFTPSRWAMYPAGVFVYFRYPSRLVDLSPEGISMKQALFSGDWTLMREAWPEMTAKSFLVVFHWCILALAILGLWKGRMSREAKIVMLTVILFAMVTIVLRTVGHIRGFGGYEPLARYRFPTEPLILLLAAAGIEYASARRLNKKI